MRTKTTYKKGKVRANLLLEFILPELNKLKLNNYNKK